MRGLTLDDLQHSEALNRAMPLEELMSAREVLNALGWNKPVGSVSPILSRAEACGVMTRRVGKGGHSFWVRIADFPPPPPVEEPEIETRRVGTVTLISEPW